MAVSIATKAYDEVWFKQWMDSTPGVINNCLRATVLTKQPAKNELGPDPERNMGKTVVKVNLPSELMQTIEEAMNLEQMGYRLGERIRYVVLLKDILINNCKTLEQILNNYYMIRRRLRSHEAEFLDRAIKDLEMNFDRGLTHITWAALGIPEYAENLSELVLKFEGIVTQINTVSKDLRIRILDMISFRLFQEPPYKRENIALPILDCWDYFKYWELYRTNIFDKLVLLYKGIAPLCRKLENLSYGKSTGKTKRFRTYYMYWEKCVFKYLTKIVIRSLNDFEIRMNVDEPLFDIEAALAAPEIRTIPSAHEIFQLLADAARDCVEGTRQFVRWRRGTCIFVTPIKLPSGDTFTYTFYHDVGRVPRILQLILQIEDNFLRIMKNLWEYLKMYRQFKNLWVYNKEKTIETFASKNPSVKLYNEKMAFYADICHRIMDLPSYRIEGCVRLNVRPLQYSIHKHAREWVLILGEYLLSGTKELARDFSKNITELDTEGRITTKTLEDLHKVVTALQAIKGNAIDMEIRYRDLLERFDVLRNYSIRTSEEEQQAVQSSWQTWQKLRLQGVKHIEKKIEPLRKKYSV